MMYNVLGTSGDWDEQCLGLIATVQTDDILAALTKLACDEFSTDEHPVTPERLNVQSVTDMGALREIYEENEFSLYFQGSECAFAEFGRGKFYSKLLVAVPVEAKVMTTGGRMKAEAG
jgi:hypothetical protein